MIRKRGHRWCVLSPNNPEWSGGCYDTKKEAQERLRQVERAKYARGVGQTSRLCWEVEQTGMTWAQAKEASETVRGSIRLSFDDEDQSWTLEVKRPCGPAHPMRRFMYTGLTRRGRRRKR